jgi:ATP synthase protein I|tara:strand:- start:8038 stop:8421 length:384 start_codon:yes stop_codon:yes gene_type:complete
MNEDRNPPVPEEETEEDFDTRLRRARSLNAELERSGGAALPEDGKGKAMRIGTELVVAVAVGGGIGFLIDSWLGTKPWFLIGFLFLGNAAGLWNVFRLTNSQGYRVGFNHDKRNDDNGTEQNNTKGD